jgi:hypothetical protein
MIHPSRRWGILCVVAETRSGFRRIGTSPVSAFTKHGEASDCTSLQVEYRRERLGSRAGTHREEEKIKNILTGRRREKHT